MAQRRQCASTDFDEGMETCVLDARESRQVRGTLASTTRPAARAASVWTSAADPGSFAELFAQPRAHSSIPPRNACPRRERSAERPSLPAPTSTPPPAPAPRVPVLPPRRASTANVAPALLPRLPMRSPARPATRRAPIGTGIVALEAHDMLPIEADDSVDVTFDTIEESVEAFEVIALANLCRPSIPPPAALPDLHDDGFLIPPAPALPDASALVRDPRALNAPRESLQSVPPVSISVAPGQRSRDPRPEPGERSSRSDRRVGSIATLGAIAAGLALGGLAAFVGQRSVATAYASPRVRALSATPLSALAGSIARSVASAHTEPRVESPISTTARTRGHHHHAASRAEDDSYDLPTTATMPVATRIEQSDPTLPFPSPVAQQRAHDDISRRAIGCAVHLERLVSVRVRYEGSTGQPVAVGFDDPTLHGTQAEECLRNAVRAVSFDPFGRRTLETTLHLYIH